MRLTGKLLFIVSITSFVLAAPALWFLGRPAYRHYRAGRALRQAHRFLARQDWGNAALSARQALQLNSRNVEACEIMARLTETLRAPQALEWRQRIVEISPTVTNKLNLAGVALAFEPPPFRLAEQTLNDVSVSATNIAFYHTLSAQLALKLNHPSEAEAHFLHASRLEPANPLHQLNWAVLRIAETNLAAANEGRAALEKVAQDPKLAPTALRSLVAASIARQELDAAEHYSSDLLDHSAATFDDRLRHLDILQGQKSPQFAPWLSALKEATLTNPPAVQGLCAWMIRHALATNAFGWLTSCPAQLRNQPSVRLALADCYGALQDWPGLEAFLQPQRWEGSESLRHGLLARAAFHQKHTSEGQAEWRLALHETGRKLGGLTALYALAGSPVPEDERGELLWRIAENFPKERWARDELHRRLLSTSDTRRLHKLYSLVSSQNPTDTLVKNNLATTSLLLNLNAPRAHELAKQNYLREGSQPAIASTYAYSLHLQGHTQAGLDVLNKLSQDALRSPQIALYYGVLLTADKQQEKSATYLKIAETGHLLPEEQALLLAARQRR